MEKSNAPAPLLKMEVSVLDLLKANNRARHFCIIYDKKRVGDVNYVAMTMVGQSVHSLRKSSAAQRFTLGTAISVGIQMLEALEDLHRVGYLHRDVTPDNYSIGRVEEQETGKIYLFDFGMARKYVNDDNIIHHPRIKAGFRGTPRYAPFAAHNDEDQGRKDDVESWFYSLVEITNGALPWREMEADSLKAAKQRVRNDEQAKEEMLRGCPAEYLQIFNYIITLTYYDKPNYEMIYNLLRAAMIRTHSTEHPYDWERTNR
jgi:tau tubulin kinase